MTAQPNRLTREAIVRGLRAKGIAKSIAERAADQELARRALSPADRPRALPAITTLERRQFDPAESAPIVAHRVDDTLRLIIETPPRTKKNGRKGAFFGIATKNTPYAKFRDELKEAIDQVRDGLALPLPDRAYNISATYVVDRYGERADRPGLEQALFDALQHAGVVSDDWWFRTSDGSRIRPADAETPRIECLITPIADDRLTAHRA